MKYEMPVLTDEQREEAVTQAERDLRMYTSDSHRYLQAQIALAALTAEPEYNIVKNDINFIVYKDAYDKFDGQKWINYTAPPMPGLKPIELPRPHREDYVGSKVMYADDVEGAIRAAGYEVEDE